MDQTYIDYLRGHGLGIREHYLDVDEFAILDDYYVKAVNSLTINNDTKAAALLQQQVSQLAEKYEEQNYIIKGKLAEKEKEAEQAKQELADMKIDMEQVKTQLANTSDQVATMLEILTKLNRHQVTTNNDPSVESFLLRELGKMTKDKKWGDGKWGEDPESGLMLNLLELVFLKFERPVTYKSDGFAPTSKPAG
jgi:seryl-tRNA synthetase